MKCFILLLAATCLAGIASAQKQQQYTTPVPILKQINKHNEDGSYSYGYEGADGSFKIETKYPDGEVYGKYGYVDDTGKVREVEYGASRRGFEPAGNDINVAPPTLKSSNEYTAPLRPGEEDDGQYREDPSVYYKDDAYNRPAPAQAQPAYRQPAYQAPSYQAPSYQAPAQPAYRQPAYQAPAQPAYRQPTYQEPAPRPQPVFRPQQHSSFDFDNFRSTLGFSQPQAKPAPAPAPVARPATSYYDNNNYNYNTNNNQGYYNPYNNGYNNNYNSGYSNNRGYTNNYTPISHEPLPYNVDLNTGSYSLNVGRR